MWKRLRCSSHLWRPLSRLQNRAVLLGLAAVVQRRWSRWRTSTFRNSNQVICCSQVEPKLPADTAQVLPHQCSHLW